MQYETIYAESHSEALKKVREKYGDSIIIMEEKWVDVNTFFGKLLGKKQFLISIAIKEKEKEYLSKKSIISNFNTLGKLLEKDRTFLNPTKRITSNLNNIEENINKEKENFFTKLNLDVPVKVVNPNSNFDSLTKDIQFIKKNLSSRSNSSEGKFFVLKNHLLEQEFSYPFIDEFLKELQESLSPIESKNKERIYEKSVEILSKSIKTTPGIGNRQIIALIGSTGVGKTTTIAKIAANFALKEKKDVTLITLDNFRIAATEQLKVYANIMNVPIHVARSPEELIKFLNSLKSEIILIDNTGLANSNTNSLKEQKRYFDEIPNRIEKHLVLSATAKKADAEKTMKAFSDIGFDKIILTKLDETETYGSFVELIELAHKPFSYFTTGQEVPEDIKIADSIYFSKKILEKWFFEKEFIPDPF